MEIQKMYRICEWYTSMGATKIFLNPLKCWVKERQNWLEDNEGQINGQTYEHVKGSGSKKYDQQLKYEEGLCDNESEYFD